MKRQKMSLADIKGKLSRADMKKILAGENQCATSWDWCDVGACSFSDGHGTGECRKNTANTKCYCAGISPSEP
jgi:hypothetical protein